jgi:hypothetical protein
VKWRIMLIVAITLNGMMVAHAQTPEGRQACMNDAFQFCQDAIPDRERVFSCLVAHRSVISAACHTVMAASLPVDQPPLKKQRLQAKITKAKHAPPQAKSAKNKAPVAKRSSKTSSKQGGGPLSLAPTKVGVPASR